MSEHTGIVKFYNAVKGYGYILCADFDEDVKLEGRYIYGGVTPQKQQAVRFQVSGTSWKPRALNVVVVGNTESEAAYESARVEAEKQERVKAVRRHRMARLRISSRGGV